MAGRIEIILPLRQAWDHMKAMLFPFDLGRWFTLGFVAWLAMLGRGGIGANFNIGRGFAPGPGVRHGAPSPREIFRGPIEFVEGHIALVGLLVGVGVLVGLTIYAAVAYLSSRGVFMYLECAYERKAEVTKPWRRARKPAWSYFLWRLLIDGTGMAAFLLVALAVAALNWPALRSGEFTAGAVATLVVAGIVFVVLALALTVVRWCLSNLVATIMYVRGVAGRAAWSELFALAQGRIGAFFLYFLLNMALAMIPAVLILPALCCCCCGACLLVLPVIAQTVLQPLLLLLRAYPLYFLAQFGRPYQLPDLQPAPVAPGAAGPTAEPTAEAESQRTTLITCPACGQEHLIPAGQPSGVYACVKCGTHFEAG